MRIDDGNLQVMDVDVILEKCPITFVVPPLVQQNTNTKHRIAHTRNGVECPKICPMRGEKACHKDF